ncbi:hypothetical protein [Orlajensenia flava]|uniref:hypothetical protein n=1 Tax=Orlajensenia flava TaxID=2565934 RepID=UPI00145527B2|nr:hypothetical protein [Glaciibacter flavus]
MTDTSGVEFPDQAGYPDGQGTLDEGTNDEATAETDEVEEFADTDERDVDGD